MSLNIPLHHLVIQSFILHSEWPYTVNEGSEVTTMAGLPAFANCSLSDLGQFIETSLSFPKKTSVFSSENRGMAMAPHSSTLAWKTPWTEEPGGLQSMGSRRVGHDWGTSLSLFTFMHWRRKWQPTAVFLPGESQGPHRVGHDWSDLAVIVRDAWRQSERYVSSVYKLSDWWTLV